ncbi:MAG TPA: malate synthase A [Dokdonella sp.]|uniref:malate synthase A n=1 Tax=Dokdonella sp. TaxID=2291710 RepID=UPI0025C0B130|nr:malate synthase A [Dokdonella sp.]MBX3691316.1 malate synthase A [Dokdonella sp.]MCW5569062.1 malate synthase A [Dokdonella sp.]HNR90810.1 malate synthase A [Dokdonella sp.]
MSAAIERAVPTPPLPAGLVLGAAADERVLTPAALAFVADLHRRFDARRRELLAARVIRQARFDAGERPDFLAETAAIRAGDWRVAPIPEVLLDRRVEITGPVDRKMIINALNSGAKVFMADFEDSTSPTWGNLVDGQNNLIDAVSGSIEYTTPEGRHYALKPDPAVLIVRPRGWHLPEKHVRVDGTEVAGALFDFGLFAFHNAKALHARARGPFLYLPKLQSHAEAALWDEVLAHAEVTLGLPAGTIKVTVLIETLPAAFEMDEILYALKDRIVGLNCGRWDYIFSCIKTLRAHREHVLPERAQVGMTVPFLKAYSELLIKTCHRRGAFAMGGMAAQIPISGDVQANEAALARVRADKQREARAGHDGTWVAHPGLIAVALAEFDAVMPAPNQLDNRRDDVEVGREDLLAVPAGTITRAGFINNVDVCVRYLAAWLDGLGCVPIHHLMEDAATAEISRAQLWQWLHHEGLALDDGTPIDFALFDAVLDGCIARLPASGLPGQQRIAEAVAMLGELTHAAELAEFLTLPAYARLA